jgi:hypothetical protein
MRALRRDVAVQVPDQEAGSEFFAMKDFQPFKKRSQQISVNSDNGSGPSGRCQ